MGKKNRKTATRRDRRKAKQTGYRRQGKSKPKLVGHGGSGQRTPKGQSKGRATVTVVGEIYRIDPLRVELGLLVKSKAFNA